MVNEEIFSSYIRKIWDDKKEEWFFSVVDVVGVLTESADPRKYWNKLSQRLREEGSQVVTDCHRLRLKAEDGKMRETDVANAKAVLRIIQSIPSKKAEPFNIWLAEVGSDRLDEQVDPELSIDRAMNRMLGIVILYYLIWEGCNKVYEIGDNSTVNVIPNDLFGLSDESFFGGELYE